MSAGEEKLIALGYEYEKEYEKYSNERCEDILIDCEERKVGKLYGLISMEELKALYEICKERGWIE